MSKVEHLAALEILDSRGNPTLRATCVVDGHAGTASVPSGASTGRAEARELRDGDPSRYGGRGCRRAVAAVEGEILGALRGRAFASQVELDRALVDLDGTPDRSRLGANSLLSVSLAFARAAAAAEGLPLYRYFSRLAGHRPVHLPRLTVNLFSGGKHAGKQVSIQDVLVVPVAARSVDESLAATWAVYRAAANLVRDRHGMRALVADEGGLAPDFPRVTSMFETAVDAIRGAGLVPGGDVGLAVDVASSHFRSDGLYRLEDRGLDSAAMIETIGGWVGAYPIVSVEDGLAEDDAAAWPALKRRLEGKAAVMGDDFLCTQAARIRDAIRDNAADALLLKVNQVGTLTDAAAALTLARGAGWSVTVSARSGETEDDWLADLAVGWGGDRIKIGSITRSERLAKYNRLLAIERETRLPLAP